jgi:aspartate kinase
MSSAPVLVQKFGGTSVATSDARRQAVEHVGRARRDGYDVALVVSAMGRRGDPYATDTLLDLLRADGASVDERDYDLMFTCGEAIAAALMSHTLRKAGIPAVALTSVQAGIYTNGQHREAEITQIDASRLKSCLAQGEVPVVTGGQGVVRGTFDYTTLGRGGSDTSGVAVGVALGATRVDIFTDVDGVATTDPRLVPSARLLEHVGYSRMHEMARFGARVVHPRALVAGWKAAIPVVVRSNFSTRPGTLIDAARDDARVTGIAVLATMRTIMVEPGDVTPGMREDWERRHLVMSLVDGPTGAVVLGVQADRWPELDTVMRSAGARVRAAPRDRAWVSLVGESSALEAHSGTTLDLLAREQVPVDCHELAPLRMTLVVPTEDMPRAVRILHRWAFE